MNNFLDKVGEIADALVKIDEKIGFKRILLYVILLLILFGIFNFKTLVKGTIEVVQDLNEEIHIEKMEKRDQLLRELSPILLEFRSTVGADRILYFEYHNSKENLVGIPFKYIDLVLQNSRYGISTAPESLYKDINVGLISNLYEAIKGGNIVYCKGKDDAQFKELFPETYDLFLCMDGTEQWAFISIPGVIQPIGMIVLEFSGNVELDVDKIKKAAHGPNTSFISRINGLIMSKR